MSAAATDNSATAAFGPNLRRIRMQRGVSLERIAADTKVGIELWSGLERNDLSRWPTGIYARAFVRAYAQAVGVDPEATVDDFCRAFPHGDRRAEKTIRGQAEIVGLPVIEWHDGAPGDFERRADRVDPGVQRRAAKRGNAPEASGLFGRLRRVLMGRT